MKSREELLNIATKQMSINQISAYEQIKERLENAASNGKTSVKMYYVYGRDITQTSQAVAERLKNEGFYVRCGCEEVTEGGLIKNFIEVSLLPFKKENNTKTLVVITLLCAIIIPLVVLIILFYLYGKV